MAGLGEHPQREQLRYECDYETLMLFAFVAPSIRVREELRPEEANRPCIPSTARQLLCRVTSRRTGIGYKGRVIHDPWSFS